MPSALKESLSSYLAFQLKPRPLPSNLQITHELEVIEQKFGIGSSSPDPYEAEKIYKKFIAVLESDDWSSLTLRDWKNSAYIFFHGDIKLASSQNFITRYKEWLFQQKNAGAWKRLISSYLRYYNYRREYSDIYRLMSEWITGILNRSNPPNGLAIWKDRHEKLNLFDKNSNTQIVVEFFLGECKSEWNTFINASGLTGELSSTGYINAVAENLLDTLQKRGGDSAHQFRPFFEEDNKLRFPIYRKKLIEALLLPWVSATPKQDYQNDIQDWLIGHFKDPRVLTHRQNGWRDVSDEALSVIKRWQVGAAIRQFFDLISQIAEETHWPYRKKFWESYCDEDHISDAWVVLGPDTWRHAVNAFGADVGAGQIAGGNHQRNHSVLMIRIGEYVFCEWSHMGKCRAWHENDAFCPKFYRTSYNAEEFRADSLRIVDRYVSDGISHMGSENYSWQHELSEFIRRMTGIRMNKNDFII